MASGQGQGHVSAVGTPNNGGPLHVHAFVLRQKFLHRVDVVQTVLPAPIAVDMFGVREPIAGGAAHVGHEDGKAAQGEELNQRHREPGKVGALLPLRPAVDVIHHRTRALVGFGGQVEPCRDAQTVKRRKRGVFALRKRLFGNAEHSFVGVHHHQVALFALYRINLRWRDGGAKRQNEHIGFFVVFKVLQLAAIQRFVAHDNLTEFHPALGFIEDGFVKP